MVEVIKHKAGDTFSYAFDPDADYTAWTVTSQAKNASTGELVQTFTVTPQGLAFRLEATASETATWPADTNLKFDVKLESPSSDVTRSETVLIHVEQGVTE